MHYSHLARLDRNILQQFDCQMPIPVSQPGEIAPDDLFEVGCYHPCLYTEAATPDDEDGVCGISLVDGTPWSCSIAESGSLPLRKRISGNFTVLKIRSSRIIGGSDGRRSVPKAVPIPEAGERRIIIAFNRP